MGKTFNSDDAAKQLLKAWEWTREIKSVHELSDEQKANILLADIAKNMRDLVYFTKMNYLDTMAIKKRLEAVEKMAKNVNARFRKINKQNKDNQS